MSERGRKCQPGCECRRHTSKKRHTPEEREAARQRQLAVNRAYARKRQSDPAVVARRREYAKARQRAWWLKYKFGLSVEQWDAMFADQGGCCYLCTEPMVQGRIHVDHDRSCCRGERSCGTCIRGLACQLCNQGIGQFGDDPDRMRRVADRLEMANRALRSRGAMPADAETTHGPGRQ